MANTKKQTITNAVVGVDGSGSVCVKVGNVFLWKCELVQPL
jgi:hypothetical protein